MSMKYLYEIEDQRGDLVDVEYFCCAACYGSKHEFSTEMGYIPTLPETDYDLFCAGCGDLMQEGLTTLAERAMADADDLVSLATTASLRKILTTADKADASWAAYLKAEDETMLKAEADKADAREGYILCPICGWRTFPDTPCGAAPLIRGDSRRT